MIRSISLALCVAFGVWVATSHVDKTIFVFAVCFLIAFFLDTLELRLKVKKEVAVLKKREDGIEKFANELADKKEKYIHVDNWVTSHPELPYQVPAHELFPSDLTPRRRDMRRRHISENVVGKFGIFMYEGENGETISAYGFSNEKFAVSLKMGIWPHETNEDL